MSSSRTAERVIPADPAVRGLFNISAVLLHLCAASVGPLNSVLGGSRKSVVCSWEIWNSEDLEGKSEAQL